MLFRVHGLRHQTEGGSNDREADLEILESGKSWSFDGSPSFGVTSVNCELAELLAKGDIPC